MSGAVQRMPHAYAVKAVWNHALCMACYRLLEPAKDPVRYHSPDYPDAECCHCGSEAEDIWYRAEPERMNCNGSGGVHAEVE